MYLSVVNILRAAPKMGGNMSHFVVGGDGFVELGEGGVERPRRIRWLGRIIMWEDCRGGSGNCSSGRVVKSSLWNKGSPGLELRKSVSEKD